MRSIISPSIWTLCAVLLFAYAGCDAPRDNPLDPGGTTYSTHPLDNNPTQITLFTIHTEHLGAALPDPDRFTVIAEAEIADDDGIDRVYLEVADTLLFVMTYDASNEGYSCTFRPEQAGLSIYNYIGASFYLLVYDDKGNVSRSERSMITRILADLPQLVSPISGSGAETSPLLIWEKYLASFEITYTVQVRTAAGSIWFERSGIEPEPVIPDCTVHREELRVDEVLPNGEYRWNVWVYDKLGNMSRSAPGLFYVSDPQ